jgi:penicillin V acylase-like amidase (Ntn superfamily)
VADCNHEIRNALQSMAGLSYPQASVEQIRAAVKRIDGALRDLLPQVQDEDGAALQWEIHQGRLTVKDRPPAVVDNQVARNHRICRTRIRTRFAICL